MKIVHAGKLLLPHINTISDFHVHAPLEPLGTSRLADNTVELCQDRNIETSQGSFEVVAKHLNTCLTGNSLMIENTAGNYHWIFVWCLQ